MKPVRSFLFSLSIIFHSILFLSVGDFPPGGDNPICNLSKHSKGPRGEELMAVVKADPNAAKAFIIMDKRLKDGKSSWATSQPEVIKRMGDKAGQYPPEKVADYYATHQMPRSCTTRPKCKFQGDGFEVDFDEYGHPRFEKFVPEIEGVGKVSYNPDAIHASGGTLPAGNKPTLMGSSGDDIADANRWIKEAYPGKARTLRSDGTKVPDGRVEILDSKTNQWVECTWHHHEDGRNLIPVPYNVHSRIGGASHSGGNSVIDKGMKDFFPSLTF